MLKIAFIGVGNRAGKYLSCLPADAKAAFLVEDFIDSLRTGRPTDAPLSTTREAHRICFLAR